jgi:hypothetical protein
MRDVTRAAPADHDQPAYRKVEERSLRSAAPATGLASQKEDG